MSDIICFRPTVKCETVGELREALAHIPDETPVRSYMFTDKHINIRYEEETDTEKNRRISLG